MIANTRQVFDAPPANQNDGVLLQVVPDARNVGRDLDAVCQPHARDFAQRRVRFLRRLGIDTRAHAAFLRRALQRRAGRLVLDPLAALAN